MRVTILAGLLLTALTTPAIAAEDSAGIGDSPWEFGANIYMWLPSAPLTLKVDQMEVGNLPENLDTILDSLKFAAMFEVEAHKGRLWFFASPVF